jgi:hypothetical protein
MDTVNCLEAYAFPAIVGLEHSGDWIIPEGWGYYEVYDNGKAGYYYLDAGGNVHSTLAQDVLVVKDGYGIVRDGAYNAEDQISIGGTVYALITTPLIAQEDGRRFTVSSLSQSDMERLLGNGMNASSVALTEEDCDVQFNPNFAEAIERKADSWQLGQGPEHPYEIRSPRQILRIDQDTDAYYTQTLDIDYALYHRDDGTQGLNHVPIGTETAPFAGYYDGQGHAVYDLALNLPTSSSVGLFGYVQGSASNDAQIRSVVIESARIEGKSENWYSCPRCCLQAPCCWASAGLRLFL